MRSAVQLPFLCVLSRSAVPTPAPLAVSRLKTDLSPALGHAVARPNPISGLNAGPA